MKVVGHLAAWALVGTLSSAGCGDVTSPNPPLPSAAAGDAGAGAPSRGVARASTRPGDDAGADGGRRMVVDGGPTPGFSDLFATIFLPSCAGGDCHAPGARGDVSVLTELNAFNSLVRFVVPGDSAGSELYKLLAAGKMPPDGPRLSSSELAAIAAWIDAGALHD
jgi:hypothetical protein